ncbi:MAG: amino acid permease [Bacteroidota bacterium]|nr:amino acid permease [Bacteroidota bacterium]
MSQLFRKKTIDQLLEEADSGHGLKRVLSGSNLVTLGIGAIIGAGIFVLSGQVAAQHAGPAIVLSFILSGVACALAGLCYAEFASMIPISGSAYTYAYATMGEFVAWIIGWDLILEYLFAASTVAVGWSGYMVSFLHDFGLNIPPEFTAATGSKLVNIPGEGWKLLTHNLVQLLQERSINIEALQHTTAILNLPAIIIVAIVTTLLVIGIKESANVNMLMVILKVFVIVTFIVLGFFFVNAAHWTPFIPTNTGKFGEFGFSGIFRGAAVIFFAYIGFDAVSTASQEAKNPKRDMPVGILGSLGISTILYILVALVLTGVVSYKLLNVPDPIAVAVNAMGPKMFWLRPIIKIAAIAGLSSVILVMLMGQPRIFYSMSNDGLLPPIFKKTHPKFKTPYVSSIITGILAMIIAGVTPIDILGELVSIGTLLAFCIVCMGVLILRYKEPNAPRAFKTPGLPYVPILGVLVCFVQMLVLPFDTWLRLIIWMVIGFLIYFLYSRKNSKLAK